MATTALAGIGSQYFGSSTTSSSTNSTNTLNQSDFLTLFTAQLQNQDPTNPMQSYELASQLAQFTTVEQLTQVSSQLNNVDQYTGGINNGSITSLVGKSISASDSTVNVSSGAVANTLNYTLSTPSTVTYKIADSSGSTIYSGTVGAQSSGSYSLPWTGTDSSGNKVSNGSYTCTVTATPTDGSTGAAAVQTTINGQIASCNLSANPPTYTLSGTNGAGGITIPVSSVSGVSSN
ncbi:MAG: flagellar hook capping FlgD N-terminal domain-containing protein [Syntrophobacteraceae bacterium]|nr:flagellar hook capping FlgD N-terminal domain-containing protein [Syntrophobacteraceae bacterium]